MGFTVGDVASVLHFVSETIDECGVKEWIFISDDSEWTARIYPNASDFDTTTARAACGYGVVAWNNPPDPDTYGSLVEWYSVPVDPATLTIYNIDTPDIVFRAGSFGTYFSELRLNWIACP
jgi:hypothetical protein